MWSLMIWESLSWREFSEEVPDVACAGREVAPRLPLELLRSYW